MEQKTVVVGLSGGVDSSVAALLLKEQGYRVIGVTMQIWQDTDSGETGENGSCGGNTAIEDARRIASQLDIPYYVCDFRQEFKQQVMDYFTGEYLHGRTPNPCVVCNRKVKWQALLDRARELGADYIATGHYAKITRLSNGRFVVTNAVTAKKDQTYALYDLTQDQLAHTLMPIGDHTKEEIREIAEKSGLVVAKKPDSQDICFIPDGDYASFVDRLAKEKGWKIPAPGNFVRPDGEILGQHKGITHYTIGQRRGLGLPMGDRIYVTGIRPETDEVVLGDNDDLFKRECKCRKINFMGIADEDFKISTEEEQERIRELVLAGKAIPEDLMAQMEGKAYRVTGKIRYGHAGADGVILRSGPDQVRAFFYEPVRAITAGQAAVFYAGDHIVCGGVI